MEGGTNPGRDACRGLAAEMERLGEPRPATDARGHIRHMNRGPNRSQRRSARRKLRTERTRWKRWVCERRTYRGNPPEKLW